MDEHIGQVAVDFGEAHKVSMKVFELLREQNENKIGTPTLLAGVALTLGRLTNRDYLNVTAEKEVGFVQDITSWASAYWMPIEKAN